MSHVHQRKEKNCLNCGAEVIGRYCHLCGQENIEPKESVAHFVVHFFNDITHFDGKFFVTLKDLLFRPGYLPREYMNGRRMRYLNPVRMYLFTSFIFFLVFFSLYHFDVSESKRIKFTFDSETDQMIDSMPVKDFNNLTKSLNHGKPMSRAEFKNYRDSVKRLPVLGVFDSKGVANYKSRAQYDSVLATGKVKDGWLMRSITYREIDINQRYENQKEKFVGDFIKSFMHHFPQILFISLPFVALFLKLLYIRRKKFYYVSHAIFTIHFYIFVFITMLIAMFISKLRDWLVWEWMGYINGLISLLIFFYLYKALRNFYQQRRGKTILKYFLFLFSFSFLIIFLFIVFGFISVFQV
ncbi:MAG: DUF3667 domain-containing protein [Ginsengibacter sp.]